MLVARQANPKAISYFDILLHIELDLLWVYRVCHGKMIQELWKDEPDDFSPFW